MKIYFGQVTAEDVEFFGTDGLLKGRTKQGEARYYYNAVEHGTNSGGLEDVTILDGCGRSIPIATHTIPELVTALMECYNNYQIIQEADALSDMLHSSTARFAVETK